MKKILKFISICLLIIGAIALLAVTLETLIEKYEEYKK